MGLSHEQHADQQRRLNPPTSNPQPAKPELVTEDPTIGNEQHIRGIPAVGRVSGTIKGTAPGPGTSGAALDREARELNENARRIVQNRLRYKPSQ